MRKVILGNSQLESSAIGLGCNRLLDSNDTESLATVNEALERGINHFDSADMYGMGRGESFLGTVLKGRREQAFIVSKFGMVPNPEGGMKFVGDPAYVRTACDRSLERLTTDHIDLYYQHRVDPDVPVEETFGAMSRLVEEGKVKSLGISNATADQIRRAHGTFPLSAVQIEYSIFNRGPETELLPLCQELGITFVAYGPLSFALLGSEVAKLDDLPEDDRYRRNMPRFHNENIEHNLSLLEILKEVADELGATTAQLTLAWFLAQPWNILPIPGSRRRDHLIENSQAVDITPSPAQMERINSAIPIGAAKGTPGDD